MANEILEYKEYTFPLWIGSLDFGLGLRLGLVKKGIVIQVTVCHSVSVGCGHRVL
mgnify:CR=1 FL=1